MGEKKVAVRIVFRFAWLNVRSCQLNPVPCGAVGLGSANLSSFLLPVFGETAEIAGHTTSGQLIVLSYFRGTYTDTVAHTVSCAVFPLLCRMDGATAEAPEFLECQGHVERGESP